jgi:ABC-2 type transport system ATP-binding protein
VTAVALRADGLGKRYGSRWALADCSFELPSGSVTALVGANGAGKSTLLNLAIGLLEPTAGRIEALGADPRSVLPRLGFVAQDHPLYRRFTLADTLTLGRKLNPHGWDDALARQRLDRLGLRLDTRVGNLSGGQQANVALTLALAKRPDVLLLDEPVASLDPLARIEFLQLLMETAAEAEVTIVLSSHLLADLERVCDHLILLTRAHVALAGPIDELLGAHRLLTGPRAEPDALRRFDRVVSASHTERQTRLLVRATGHVYDSRWQVDEAGLEEIVLAYMRSEAA